jgi:hypothetical protein
MRVSVRFTVGVADPRWGWGSCQEGCEREISKSGVWGALYVGWEVITTVLSTRVRSR